MKKVFLGLVALVAAYLAAAALMAMKTKASADAFNAELVRLAALADAAKPGGDLPLSEACAKVPRVGRLALISYFQKPDSTLISEELEKERYESRQFRAFSPENFKVEGTHVASNPWTLGQWVYEFLGNEPWRWDWVQSRAVDPFDRNPSETKYLVVHQLASLTLPRVRSTDYDPGHMTFRSAVLDAKSGAVLCEGSTALDQSGDIPVAASGTSQSEAERRLEERKEDQVLGMFFIDLHFFALRDVCWLGNEKLCELTFGKFVAPP
jgi:hypothetical protein